MKIINKYILVAAASLSVVACSQDDGLSNSYLKDSDAVHITAQVGSNEATGGFISRSNPLGSEVEQAKFNEGDAILLLQITKMPLLILMMVPVGVQKKKVCT